ncbi:MAG: hypothetical protein ABJH99_08835, partial [Tateyamaria sp.]
SKPTRNITSSDLIEADGRVEVDAMLRVPARPSIFAAGDVARAKADPEHDTLMSCQHAMPMGVAAGRNAVLACSGLALRPYEQPFYATCLDLGDAGAVFTQGWDRQVEKVGPAGAEMKADINTKWIYPPSPTIGRDQIFAMIAPQID